jgi:hypothetical protein
LPPQALLARKLWLSSELEVEIEKKELEFEQGPLLPLPRLDLNLRTDLVTCGMLLVLV